jgi:DNA-binding NarL/FixJ family response regulator
LKKTGGSEGESGVKALKLHHSDLALIEDELKPEIDVLTSLVKLVNTTRANLEQISNENNHMIDALRAQLLGNAYKYASIANRLLITRLAFNCYSESSQNNQNLTVEILRLSRAKLPDDQNPSDDKRALHSGSECVKRSIAPVSDASRLSFDPFMLKNCEQFSHPLFSISPSHFYF